MKTVAYMPYMIVRKGLKVICISYTVEAAYELIYDLIDQGCTLEPSDMETYLNKGVRQADGSIALVTTMHVNSNTGKVII